MISEHEKMRLGIMTRMIVNKVNKEAEGKDKPRMDPNTQRQWTRKLAKVNEKIEDIGFKLDVFPQDISNETDKNECKKLEKALDKNLKEKMKILQILGFNK